MENFIRISYITAIFSIPSIFSQNLRPTCIPLNEICKFNETYNGVYCCSDHCFQLPNTSTGFCREKTATTKTPNSNSSAAPPSAAPGNGLVIGMGVAGFIAITLLAAGLVALWRMRLTAQDLRRMTAAEIEEFLGGWKDYKINVDENTAGEPSSCVEHALALPFDRKFEVLREDLVLDRNRVLGRGQFGVVFLGQFRDLAVAIKTTKPSTHVDYLKALLSELKLMAYIGRHDNIVEFIGASTAELQNNIVYVIVELSPFGDLLTYMKRNRETFNYGAIKDIKDTGRESKLTARNFANWSRQIANGMAFLEQKKVVHADLAARNILVFPNDVVKITDFGLSRQIFHYEKYVKKSKTPVAWRWLSLEALRFMEFSSHSDVWAFAVTLFEIYTLGQVPFPDKNWTRNFLEQVENGLRLDKPNYATDEIYAMMLKCWDLIPPNRPSFENLRDFFRKIHADLD